MISAGMEELLSNDYSLACRRVGGRKPPGA